jgi:uncharacterized protein (DUF2342 family)
MSDGSTAQSLDAFLAEREADADTIQQAARTWLTRRSGFLSPEEMRARLDEASGDPEGVSEALALLQRDSGALEAVAREVLERGWSEPDEAAAIARAVDGAKVKMPVIEVGLLALVVMYGMYLKTTGGVKSEHVEERKGADGSTYNVTHREYEDPTAPLSMVRGIVQRRKPNV